MKKLRLLSILAFYLLLLHNGVRAMPSEPGPSDGDAGCEVRVQRVASTGVLAAIEKPARPESFREGALLRARPRG